jgi:DNA-binding NarL/FixJ family response regulator
MDKIGVLIIDDHKVLRQSIAKVLGAQPDMTMMHCGSVGEGLLLVGSGHVDIVILDVDLGTERGTEFMELARRNGFKGPVLVLTAGVSDSEKEQLWQQGVTDILMKDDSIEKLTERIREAMGRQPEGGVTVMPSTTHYREPNPRPFSQRETRVLRLVVQGRANKEIAEELHCTESTVKAVLQQLFRSTGTHSRSQLLGVALQEYKDLLQ